MSSEISGTAASATSHIASSTNLFPTTTASGANRDNNGINSGSPTTYYFVFLGVLVVLLCIAASLAYRAFRIRRQFRSAAQLALMRGEPPPRLQDDYWAMGILTPWRVEDAMREHAREQAGINGGAGGADGGAWVSRRGGKKARWENIPVLWEWEVERGEKQGLGDVTPVSLHATIPPETDLPDPSAAGNTDPTSVPPPASSSHVSPLINPREFWRRERERGAQYRDAMRSTHPAFSATTHPLVSPPPRNKSLGREVGVGDEVRAAVIIQMPLDDEMERAWSGSRGGIDDDGNSDDAFDDDEKPGWQPGMEIGVWDGRLGGRVGAGGEEDREDWESDDMDKVPVEEWRS